MPTRYVNSAMSFMQTHRTRNENWYERFWRSFITTDKLSTQVTDNRNTQMIDCSPLVPRKKCTVLSRVTFNNNYTYETSIHSLRVTVQHNCRSNVHRTCQSDTCGPDDDTMPVVWHLVCCRSLVSRHRPHLTTTWSWSTSQNSPCTPLPSHTGTCTVPANKTVYI